MSVYDEYLNSKVDEERRAVAIEASEREDRELEYLKRFNPKGYEEYRLQRNLEQNNY